jgi:penicillin amidase
MMAWDLSAHGYRNELARLRLAARLSVAEINDLRPPYPGDQPLPVADYVAAYRLLGLFASSGEGKAAPRSSLDAMVRDLAALQPQSGFGVGSGLGSNNWVLAGSRTVSGKPLLANDPHLGLSTPSVWYFARIETPELQVAGGTLPGVPFVIIGRTPGVAWGLTNTNTDVQDLYLERLHPSDAQQYQTPDGFASFETREEVIRVRNAPDVRFKVRLTRHGPVLSDA